MPTPIRWQVPTKLSAPEQRVADKLRRIGKFHVFLREIRAELFDRTVALAKQTGRFGWQALRAALDSSPLVGAGRVEDTWNLIGRALRTVATCAAETLRSPAITCSATPGSRCWAPGA